jgi:hypothetical protein
MPDLLINSVITDIIETDIVLDVLGDAGSGEVYNLLLETGDDFLLEDGSSFILLE